jgi:hypothetical protein
MNIAARLTVSRTEQGTYHRAAYFGSRLTALCETADLVFEVVRIPDEVSDEQLCDAEGCWPRREFDVAEPQA